MTKKEIPSVIQYVVNSENHREVTINHNSVSIGLISSNEAENMDFLVEKAMNILKEVKEW